MSTRSGRTFTWLSGVVTATALVSVASISLLAQGAADKTKATSGTTRTTPARKFTPPRTPWGDPDLQGVWDYRTITPLERPQNMAGRQFLTDEEVHQLEARAAKRL